MTRSRRRAASGPRRQLTQPEFTSALEQPFVLLCGSAISARAPSGQPFLPMVIPAMASFFALTAERLKKGTYLHRLSAGYAEAIWEPRGAYHRLLRDTKFEEFVARLEEIVGVDNANRWLSALFSCSPGEFNFNHAAICRLLETGAARACITTNFDNAIEQAAAVPLPKYVGYDLPAALAESPVLLKPHGCVETGEYVATTAALYSAKRKRRFDALASLLSHRTVVVVGYSGFGDVDIEPQLRRAAEDYGTNFLWTLAPGADPASIPAYARYAQYDLFRTEPDANWLVGLAQRSGLAPIRAKPGPDWRSRLQNWIDGLSDIELCDSILNFMARRAGWAFNHLIQVRTWSRPRVDRPRLHLGRALIDLTDYRSALHHLAEPAGNSAAQIAAWKGFCLWRLGLERDALETLEPFARTEIVEEKDAPALANCRRHFLEISRDRLRRAVGSKRRKEIFAGLRLAEIVEAFPRGIDFLSGEEEILTRLAIQDLHRLLGRPKNLCLAEVRELLQAADNIQYKNGVLAAARLLALLNTVEGGRYLLRRGAFRRGTYSFQTLRKSLLFLIVPSLPYEALWMDLGDGRILARAHATWAAWLVRRRRSRWRSALEVDRLIYA